MEALRVEAAAHITAQAAATGSLRSDMDRKFEAQAAQTEALRLELTSRMEALRAEIAAEMKAQREESNQKFAEQMAAITAQGRASAPR